jgi:phage shock protein C
MEQSNHIRLSGHADAVPLSPAAHDRLLRYLAESRMALSDDPDADETVRDLESSLGDRLLAIVASTNAPVDDEQMAEALQQVGAVETQGAPDGQRGTDHEPRGPCWCRIADGRWFGGLCLGIAARGEFRVDWVRTIVFFLLLITGGIVGLVYLVLLLILPRVQSVAEYERLRDGAVTHSP